MAGVNSRQQLLVDNTDDVGYLYLQNALFTTDDMTMILILMQYCVKVFSASADVV
jgi:hypothetical protein